MTAINTKGTHRILVIDDNPSILDDFRKILIKPTVSQNDLIDIEFALFGCSDAKISTSSAFEIDCASQGREGLEMVERAQAEGRPYALAFVDGRMPPGYDGIETIRHLWEKCPDLQVVLCTAYAYYSWQEIRNVLGESDSLLILKKPFDNADELLKNADLAMYFAKRIGPNTYKFYHPSMNASGLKRLTIENHLRKAIEQDEFSLHYQPQFDLVTNRLSGMEALLRWDNWELGNVPPMEFIPIAEECGLIVSIGESVLKTACNQAAAWIEEGLPLQRMAVNLSVKQLEQPDFIQMVKNILAETGLALHHLEFEVTESLLENDSCSFISTLDALRGLNIRIAVEDFGNRYSNMSRLKDMPFDCIKIDRSFINNIDGGTMNQSILTAILAMAKAMNVRVVAEGVERSAQVDFLCGKQCHEAQGYLFGRPLSAPRAGAFLRRCFFTLEHEEKNRMAKTC